MLLKWEDFCIHSSIIKETFISKNLKSDEYAKIPSWSGRQDERQLLPLRRAASHPEAIIEEEERYEKQGRLGQ